MLRLEDSSLRKLTDGEPGLVAPSFSSDGKSVYCTQASNSTTTLYRVAIEGGFRELLWSGSSPAEAPGRNTLLYSKAGKLGIYERSLRGDPRRNPEVQILSDPVPGIQHFCPTHDGVFYAIADNSKQGTLIRYYSFATRQCSDVATVGADSGESISVSRDGAILVYDAPATDSQLIEMKIQ